jgi:hypothetical protein
LQQLKTSDWPRDAEKQLEAFVISTISLGAPDISASGFFKIRRPLCTAVSKHKLSPLSDYSSITLKPRILLSYRLVNFFFVQIFGQILSSFVILIEFRLNGSSS